MADDHVFVGLDAYQRVIENVDLVILATPPGFRPLHIQAAVAARKNIFTEKPVAVDGPGVRMVLAAHEEAERNHLSIVSGLQRRYQTEYLESMRRIHDGQLGTITSARCYWNQGRLWHKVRTPQMTDVEWQIRNWLYFTWLSGDHICEQHIHNLDVINWALNNHPTRAVGMGGRQVRTGPEFGKYSTTSRLNINIRTTFMFKACAAKSTVARTISRKPSPVPRGVGSPAATGSRAKTPGHCHAARWIGAVTPIPMCSNMWLCWTASAAALRRNDLKRTAESTLTAIMGRMSAYTGKAVTWEAALNSQMNLMPANLAWNMTLPVAPVAVPGTTPLT